MICYVPRKENMKTTEYRGMLPEEIISGQLYLLGQLMVRDDWNIARSIRELGSYTRMNEKTTIYFDVLRSKENSLDSFVRVGTIIKQTEKE